MQLGIDALFVTGKLEQQVAALLAEVEAVVTGDEGLNALGGEGFAQACGKFCGPTPGALFTPADVNDEFFLRCFHPFKLSSPTSSGCHP